MSLRAVTVIFSAFFIHLGTSKIRFILDEELQNCSDQPWKLDASDFKLVMINDTTTVSNGTMVFTEEIKSPWKLKFTGELYDRGQWQKKFSRKFDDYCKHVLSPTEIWYQETNKRLDGKECPYPKGMSITYNEEPVVYDTSNMPPSFQGRWRITVEGDVGCMRVHFDFVDD